MLKVVPNVGKNCEHVPPQMFFEPIESPRFDSREGSFFPDGYLLTLSVARRKAYFFLINASNDMSNLKKTATV